MPKVSQEHKDARRQMIVDTALDLIAAFGVRDMSVAMLRDSSGFSLGCIYSYFKDKEAIVCAVAENALLRGRSDTVSTRRVRIFLLAEALAAPDSALAKFVEKHRERFHTPYVSELLHGKLGLELPP